LVIAAKEREIFVIPAVAVGVRIVRGVVPVGGVKERGIEGAVGGVESDFVLRIVAGSVGLAVIHLVGNTELAEEHGKPSHHLARQGSEPAQLILIRPRDVRHTASNAAPKRGMGLRIKTPLDQHHHVVPVPRIADEGIRVAPWRRDHSRHAFQEKEAAGMGAPQAFAQTSDKRNEKIRPRGDLASLDLSEVFGLR
jgi:hypothetical protein